MKEDKEPKKLSLAKETKLWMQDGQAGNNTGLSMGLPRLEKYIPGLQASTTYVIAGESGSGKSKLAASMFIYNPYEELMEIGQTSKLRVLLFSLEITARQVAINAAIWRLYQQYGELVDVNQVLSRGVNRCSTALYQAVSQQLDFYEALEDVLIINDEGMGPTGINKAVVSYFLKHGTLHYREVDNGDGPFKIPHYYEPSEKGMIVSPQIDHLGLLRGEKDLAGKKGIIDKLSTDYGITWRNRFGASPLFVMQMNRGIGATDRAKLDRMRPQLSDIADSSNPAQDANVVLGIFSPTRYGIPQYEGYDVAKLRERFRAISIMKNRNGESDKMVGTRFIGETGDFTELPPPKDMLLPGAYEKALRV